MYTHRSKVTGSSSRSEGVRREPRSHEVSAAHAGPVAGSPSNTNPPKFADEITLSVSDALKPSSRFRTLHLGFDTVEWNLSTSNEVLEFVVPHVASFVGSGEQSFDGYTFIVSRVGGFSYRYKLTFAHGFDVYLPDDGFARYGMRVVAHSKPCLVSDDLEHDALAVLSFLVGLPSQEFAPALSLSRVDVCLDVEMPDAEFQRFCKQVATRSRFVVTRARHIDSFMDGDRYIGVSVGKNEVKLRTYDKKAEAVQDGDWKLWSTVYGRGEGFDLVEGSVVARFEYQLRRDFLKQCCMHGVDQHHDCPGLRSLADFKIAKYPTVVSA